MKRTFRKEEQEKMFIVKPTFGVKYYDTLLLNSMFITNLRMYIDHSFLHLPRILQKIE